MVDQSDGVRPVRLVGLAGSLDGSSASLHALQAALAAAELAGAQVQVFDVATLQLPLYAWGMTPPPAAVAFVEAVHAADGLVWASPLYHGTVSGAFKNAVDWLELLSSHQPPYLTDKAIGLICTAGGQQGLQAINTMEYMVRSLRGITCPLVVPIAAAHRAFDETGVPVHERLADQLGLLGREVTRLAGKLRNP